MRNFFYILLFVCLAAYTAQAQTAADSSYFEKQYFTNQHYVIKTSTGEIYRGYLKKETRDSILLSDNLTRKTIALKKTDILRADTPKRAASFSELSDENLHAKNYLFLSSAFLYEERKLSTTSHWLLLENINYAFTENWAISLNTLAFYPLTLGVNYVQEINKNNYAGATLFGIGDITSDGNGSFIFGYGAQLKYTHGYSNNNITVSGGILGLNSDLFYISTRQLYVNTAFVSAAYCKRFSTKAALNLEAWYLPDAAIGLCGAGLKFVGNEFICWTVGCYALMNNQNNSLTVNLKTLPIPYLGVSRRFD